jgi:hypothetical protein
MCNFSINYPKAKDQLISQFSSTVIAQPNGQFEGDETTGAFSFTAMGFNISGNYTINGDLIEINVLEKPFLLSCSRIEAEIKRYLGI